MAQAQVAKEVNLSTVEGVKRMLVPLCAIALNLIPVL
jgi:hypothetical protein